MKVIETKVTEIYRRVNGNYAISMLVFVFAVVFLNSLFVCCIHNNLYVRTFNQRYFLWVIFTSVRWFISFSGESDGLPIPKDRGSTKYTTFVNGSLKKFRISSTLDDEDGKVINMAVNYLDVSVIKIAVFPL